VIAFNGALNFEAYTAWIASDDHHVAYENVALDEFYTTAYSDLYEQCRSKICTQMYMSFLTRVQVCVGYNFPRFTVGLFLVQEDAAGTRFNSNAVISWHSNNLSTRQSWDVPTTTVSSTPPQRNRRVSQNLTTDHSASEAMSRFCELHRYMKVFTLALCERIKSIL
jgi:formyltetrahydrofolate hydrolase